LYKARYKKRDKKNPYRARVSGGKIYGKVYDTIPIDV
jgi:hypothetical protein